MGKIQAVTKCIIGLMVLAFCSCSQEELNDASSEKLFTVSFVSPDGLPKELDTKVNWSGSTQSYAYQTNVTANGSTWCTSNTDWVALSGGDEAAKTLDKNGTYNIATAIAKDYTITVKTGGYYQVNVTAGTGGTAYGGGSCKYEDGKTAAGVGISAAANSGYTFKGWTVSSGTASLANASAASTTVVPSSNCTVTANFVSDTPVEEDILLSVTQDNDSYAYKHVYTVSLAKNIQHEPIAARIYLNGSKSGPGTNVSRFTKTVDVTLPANTQSTTFTIELATDNYPFRMGQIQMISITPQVHGTNPKYTITAETWYSPREADRE